jgi:class 3 adenylate cyclase
VGGELGPLATALIYCTTISACHRVGDYRRAAEWTDAAEACAVNPGRSDFPGDCHAHRVGVLHMHGKWDEAEREGEKAFRVEGQEETHVGMALYEVGEILLRRGELDRAEETFRRAEDMGRTPQPGRALLLLARGKGEAAVSSIAGALADESWDRLARGRLLPGAVEVAIATRELLRARAAADELETIATSYGTTALEAAAQVALGSVLHAEGSAEAAAYFRKAFQLWQEVDAPYEVARARLALAEVLSAGGDIDGGAAEARVARTLFERLGTLPDISRAQALQARAEGTRAAAAEATSRSVRSFMFTDIVGSTSLIEAIGDDAWASLVRWHDQALRAQFKAHAGEEIDNAGDGFFIAFEDAERAIACAVEIQRALASQRESQGFAPQVRIGLHTAEATRQGEGYTGSGVHRAARIGALAGAGEILISTQTLEGTGGSFEISGARTVELKGMSEPANIALVVWDHR